MMVQPSFMADFLKLSFSPRQFFAARYRELDSKRIHALGVTGTFLGLALGNGSSYGLSTMVEHNFNLQKDAYLDAIKNLGLTELGFIDMLLVQRGYYLLVGVLSPIVALMAPHIFGGSLFAFLWLLTRPEKPVDFSRVMACASIALGSMIFYAIPAVGPAVAVIMVSVNLSRALYVEYKMIGFMKAMSIVSAIYICFFLSAASFQLLAEPVASWLK